MGTAVVVGPHQGSDGPFDNRSRCATNPTTGPISTVISRTDRVRCFGSICGGIRPVKHLYGIWRILQSALARLSPFTVAPVHA